MNKSTTIINHINTDRITEIIISKRKYIVFTLTRRNLIVVDISDKKKPILLLNRNFTSNDALSKEFDKIIISGSNSITDDDFVSTLDTYIELDSNINETTEEILGVCKIIIEDYNL